MLTQDFYVPMRDSADVPVRARRTWWRRFLKRFGDYLVRRGNRVAIIAALGGAVVCPVASAQDYAFVARHDTGTLLKDYKLLNAPALPTNACADSIDVRGQQVRLYRLIVSSNEYAAGWAALPQARKDAAKAAAAAERSDFDARFDKLLKAFALVVLDEINLIRQNVTSNTNLPARTEAQLKAAIKNKYEALP